jgi:hypothetical protein
MGEWVKGQQGKPLTPHYVLESILTFYIQIYIKSMVLLPLMAQRINAFLAPLVAACGLRPPVSPVPVPALCDAQEALQEANIKRQKEDLAVEEGVNEVLA